MLLGSQLDTDLVSTPMTRADKWRVAYRFALANAAIFLLLAVTVYVFEVKTLAVIQLVPAVFFLGSTLSFLTMVWGGGELAAIAWFVLGSGIYFGIGAVAGGLHVHPHSLYLFADDTLYLARVNLLNACSVVIVLVAAYPLANKHRVKTDQQEMSLASIEKNLLRFLPFIVVISAVGVGLKFMLFPVAESLLLRSMAAKLYLIIPSCFLLLGLVWHSAGWHLRLIAGSVFLLEILNGLIGFTKYQVMAAILALAIGMWLTRRSMTFVLMTLVIMASVFVVINPVVTLGRAHVDYDAEMNTVTTRLAILADAIQASANSEKFMRAHSEKFTHDVRVMSPIEARLKALGRRFDVASMQGYLINEFNAGRPGNTLVDYWAVLIPRALWPEKPIITRFGVELNAQYYYVPGGSIQNSSSTAPTYSAEAYWNYGPLGVVIVSILLGLAMGWLTRHWQLAMVGRDPAFLFIAFPVAIWASFVESWVVATYFGEFIIFVVILILTRALIALFDLLKDRVFS